MFTFLYTDYWSRKVYRSENGTKLVDVDGVLHTMSDCGEPDCPTKHKAPA